MPRKLVPGDWCRVNDKVPDLWKVMFDDSDDDGGFGGIFHFVLVEDANSPSWPGKPICAKEGEAPWENWNYPRAALTFLFHEEEKKDE